MSFTERELIIETVNKIFIYTDNQEWEKLQNEVFVTGPVMLDMSSVGAGEPSPMKPQDICAMWEIGFNGIDQVHHQAGNYLVTINGSSADVFVYAFAVHYKKAATQGNTRTFTGSYNIGLRKTENGWRIDAFKYNLKYMDGNVELK